MQIKMNILYLMFLNCNIYNYSSNYHEMIGGRNIPKLESNAPLETKKIGFIHMGSMGLKPKLNISLIPNNQKYSPLAYCNNTAQNGIKNIFFLSSNMDGRDFSINSIFFTSLIVGSGSIAYYCGQKTLNMYRNHQKPYIPDVRLAIPIIHEEMLNFYGEKAIDKNIMNEFIKKKIPLEDGIKLECEPEFRRAVKKLLAPSFQYMSSQDEATKKDRKKFFSYVMEAVNKLSALNEKHNTITHEIVIKYIENIQHLLHIIHSLFTLPTIPPELYNGVVDFLCFFTYQPNALIKHIFKPEVIVVFMNEMKNLKERRSKQENCENLLMKFEKKTDINKMTYIHASYDKDIPLNIFSILDEEFLYSTSQLSHLVVEATFTKNPILQNICKKFIKKHKQFLHDVIIMPSLYYHQENTRLKEKIFNTQNPLNQPASFVYLNQQLDKSQKEKKEFMITSCQNYIMNQRPIREEPHRLKFMTKNINHMGEKSIPPYVIENNDIYSNKISTMVDLIMDILKKPLPPIISRCVLNLYGLVTKNYQVSVEDIYTILQSLASEENIGDEELKIKTIKLIKLILSLFEEDIPFIPKKMKSGFQLIETLCNSTQEEKTNILATTLTEHINKNSEQNKSISSNGKEINKRIKSIINSLSLFNNTTNNYIKENKYLELFMKNFMILENLENILYVVLYKSTMEKIQNTDGITPEHITYINNIIEEQQAVSEIHVNNDIKKKGEKIQTLPQVAQMISNIVVNIINFTNGEQKNKINIAIEQFIKNVLEQIVSKKENGLSLEIIHNPLKQLCLNIFEMGKNLSSTQENSILSQLQKFIPCKNINTKNPLMHDLLTNSMDYFISIMDDNGENGDNELINRIASIWVKYLLSIMADSEHDSEQHRILWQAPLEQTVIKLLALIQNNAKCSFTEINNISSRHNDISTLDAVIIYGNKCFSQYMTIMMDDESIINIFNQGINSQFKAESLNIKEIIIPIFRHISWTFANQEYERYSYEEKIYRILLELAKDKSFIKNMKIFYEEVLAIYNKTNETKINLTISNKTIEDQIESIAATILRSNDFDIIKILFNIFKNMLTNINEPITINIEYKAQQDIKCIPQEAQKVAKEVKTEKEENNNYSVSIVTKKNLSLTLENANNSTEILIPEYLIDKVKIGTIEAIDKKQDRLKILANIISKIDHNDMVALLKTNGGLCNLLEKAVAFKTGNNFLCKYGVYTLNCIIKIVGTSLFIKEEKFVKYIWNIIDESIKNPNGIKAISEKEKEDDTDSTESTKSLSNPENIGEIKKKKNSNSKTLSIPESIDFEKVKNSNSKIIIDGFFQVAGNIVHEIKVKCFYISSYYITFNSSAPMEKHITLTSQGLLEQNTEKKVNTSSTLVVPKRIQNKNKSIKTKILEDIKSLHLFNWSAHINPITNSITNLINNISRTRSTIKPEVPEIKKHKRVINRLNFSIYVSNIFSRRNMVSTEQNTLPLGAERIQNKHQSIKTKIFKQNSHIFDLNTYINPIKILINNISRTRSTIKPEVPEIKKHKRVINRLNFSIYVSNIFSRRNMVSTEQNTLPLGAERIQNKHQSIKTKIFKQNSHIFDLNTYINPIKILINNISRTRSTITPVVTMEIKPKNNDGNTSKLLNENQEVFENIKNEDNSDISNIIEDEKSSYTIIHEPSLDGNTNESQDLFTTLFNNIENIKVLEDNNIKNEDNSDISNIIEEFNINNVEHHSNGSLGNGEESHFYEGLYSIIQDKTFEVDINDNREDTFYSIDSNPSEAVAECNLLKTELIETIIIGESKNTSSTLVVPERIQNISRSNMVSTEQNTLPLEPKSKENLSSKPVNKKLTSKKKKSKTKKMKSNKKRQEREEINRQKQQEEENNTRKEETQKNTSMGINSPANFIHKVQNKVFNEIKNAASKIFSFFHN